MWLSGQQVRTMAAPLCEEDLGHRGDEIILGEVTRRACLSGGSGEGVRNRGKVVDGRMGGEGKSILISK